MDDSDKLKYLQGSMLFLASIANGLEDLVGRGAPSVTFRAGRTVGMKADVKKQETEILEAFESLKVELGEMKIHWDFEPYKKKSEKELFRETENGLEVKMVFRECMVRSCQFLYGHPQKNSLCMLQHGIFCGLLERIYGASWAGYEPIHSGENACIGLLTIKQRKNQDD